MKQMKKDEKNLLSLPYLSFPGVHFNSRGAFLQKKINKRTLENILK